MTSGESHGFSPYVDEAGVACISGKLYPDGWSPWTDGSLPSSEKETAETPVRSFPGLNDTPDISVGQTVSSRIYGRGKITSVMYEQDGTSPKRFSVVFEESEKERTFRYPDPFQGSMHYMAVVD